jgi:hypothetical protein
MKKDNLPSVTDDQENAFEQRQKEEDIKLRRLKYFFGIVLLILLLKIAYDMGKDSENPCIQYKTYIETDSFGESYPVYDCIKRKYD